MFLKIELGGNPKVLPLSGSYAMSIIEVTLSNARQLVPFLKRDLVLVLGESMKTFT